jgi:DNA-binding NarL/FixJ family response regulator
MTIRVLIADDQAVVRAGFRVLVDLADDLTVVAEAADGRDAVNQARAARADVVLMDLRMPGTDGITATRQITTDPDLAYVRVLALTTFDTDEHIFGALDAGASGFLLKDVDADQLHTAIRTIAAGHSLLDPTITTRVLAELGRRTAPTPVAPERLDDLTDREREAVRLAAQGLTNNQIAEQLVISPHTAKTHINRAMAKLAARDRAQLVVIAYQTGLANPPDTTGSPPDLSGSPWQG